MEMLSETDKYILRNSYLEFKNSEAYKIRDNQRAFVKVAQLIFARLIEKGELSNKNIKALFSLFDPKCLENTFKEKLGDLELSEEANEEINKVFLESGERGYTSRRDALRSNELNNDQLKTVFNFLKTVSEAADAEAIKEAVKTFESKKIPEIKKGTYSCWLHYLNPNICPIVADRDEFKTFVEKFGKFVRDYDYTILVDFFKDVKDAVGENDLGLIDAFVVNWREDYKSDEVCLLGASKDAHQIERLREKLKEANEFYKWNYSINEEQQQLLKIPFRLYLGKDSEITCYCLCKYYTTNEAEIENLVDPENPSWDTEHPKDPWKTRILFKVAEIVPIPSINISSLKDIHQNQLTLLRKGFSSFYLSQLNRAKNDLNSSPKNRILYGPPGTGKTFVTKKLSVSVIENG